MFARFRKAVLTGQFSHAIGIVREVKQSNEIKLAFLQSYYLQEDCEAQFLFKDGTLLKEKTSLLGFIIFHAQKKLMVALFDLGVSLVPKNKKLTSPLIMLLHAIGAGPIDQNYQTLIEGILFQTTKERNLDTLLKLTDNRRNTLDTFLQDKAGFVVFQFKMAQAKKYSIRQRRIGSFEQYKRYSYTSKFYETVFANACFLDIPDPERQKGPNCGYYALGFVAKYWQDLFEFKFFYYARRRDTLFCRGLPLDISFKKLGKKAGIEGVGGLYNVHYFADIVAETEFYSQVVTFSTEEELKNIVLKALKNNLPVILPVDWGSNGVEWVGGECSHYVTLLGYVDYGAVQTISYVSSDVFYQSSLSDLFKSNNNLQKTSAKLYSKAKAKAEWVETIEESTALAAEKIYTLEDQSLEYLRHHAVLIYPRSLQNQYEKIFIPFQSATQTPTKGFPLVKA